MPLLILEILLSVSGVWNAWGYNSGEWAELAPLLSRNGYDTVYYCAAYGLETDIIGLNECIAACNEYNIDVNAWIVMWKIGKSSEQNQSILRNAGRTQLSLDDDIRAQSWLCPTDPANIAAMASVCLEIAAISNIKGIHLDYIRYASNRVCFCDGCRERFQDSSNLYGIRWPDDCSSSGRLFPDYNQWRSLAITSAVSAVRDSLNRLNKVVELSAAVLPRERQMSYYAQYWNEWLSAGLIDYVVPMNYTLSDSELTEWGNSQLNLSEGFSIPCGLSTYLNEEQFSSEEMAAQQSTAIEMGFDGWVMFHLSDYLISLLERNQTSRVLHR